MNDIKLHPTLDELAAFGLGRLGEAESLSIEEHLAQCETCRQAVETAPADSFVGKLRGSCPRTEAEDGGGRGISPAATQTLAPGAVSTEVPPELASHPRYKVLGLLGVGGMGAVFKAEHLLMERPVALKVINQSFVANSSMLDRFRREVKAAGRLTHPNIVHAYDADQAGDVHFLVMEYVEGMSLAKLLAERGPLPVAEACDYIRQAALGLQHAFERGMVHRDIKPQNLMVAGIRSQESGVRSQASGIREGDKPRDERSESRGSAASVVKILDFGLARFAVESAPAGALLAPPAAETLPALAQDQNTPVDSLTQVGMVMGTPDYIAPEQARDAHAADIRADIYSLGCTLYDLLAGRPPFPEGTAMQKVIGHLERTPRPIAELRPAIPGELAQVIDKMLAKDPAERYQTPAEVAEALTPFTKSEPEASATAAVEPAGTVAHASGPHRQRRRLRFALAASLAVAACVLAYLFIPPVREFAQTVIRIATNKGVLVIEADDEDLQITIKQNGKVVVAEVVSKKTKRSFELSASEGQIEVKGLADDRRLKTTEFALERGGRKTFSARMLLADRPDPTAEPRWIQLFTGNDLSGWEGDTAKWSWQAGALVLNTHFVKETTDRFLRSAKVFKDFELKFEAQLDNNFAIADVLVRGKAAVTIGPAKNLGCFATQYGNGKSLKGPKDKDALAKVLKLGFNDFYVRCAGKHVTLRINGITAIDDEFADLADEGILGFHMLSAPNLGAQITFRNIVVRELPLRKRDSALQPLFNGKDLTGWEEHNGWPGDKGAWTWKNGKLVGEIFGGSYLISTRSFQDFELKFRVRGGSDEDIRCWLNVRSVAKGDNKFGRFVEGPCVPIDKHLGGFYTKGGYKNTLKPPRDKKQLDRALLQKLGSAEVSVRCQGKRITIRVNGVTTVDEEFDIPQTGVIACHGLRMKGTRLAIVEFEDIQIRELPAAKTRTLDFGVLKRAKADQVAAAINKWQRDNGWSRPDITVAMVADVQRNSLKVDVMSPDPALAEGIRKLVERLDKEGVPPAPAPLEAFKAKDIPAEQLAGLTDKDVKTPTELVGILDRGQRNVVAINGLSFSPDGKLLAYGEAQTHRVILWDLETRRERQAQATGEVLGFDRGGKRLVVHSGGDVQLWDIAGAPKMLWEKKTHVPAAFARECGLLAIGNKSFSEVTIFELKGDAFAPNRTLKDMPPRKGGNVALAPGGQWLAVFGHDRTEVQLWDLRSQEKASKKIKTRHHTSVFAGAFSPDAKMIALNGDTAKGALETELWDLRENPPVLDSKAAGPMTSPLAFSPNSHMLAMLMQTEKPGGKIVPEGIAVAEKATGKLLRLIRLGRECRVTSLAFAPGDRHLVAGLGDGRVLVLRLEPPPAVLPRPKE